MKKEDFEGLKQSVIEAGKIRRGDARPSREFISEASETGASPSKAFAVCIETDDEDLLIPRKIYEIEITGEYARVIDEAGGAAVYPSAFFIPINLSAEVQQIIARL
jgi:hypothetical protein